MTHFRDDDDIYRAKLVYLGPVGWTLPVHLPYAQLFVGAFLIAVFSLVLFLLTGDPAWTGAGIAAGLAVTHIIWRFVDFDRPARAVVRAAVIDRKKIEPPAAGAQLPRLAARITIRPEITKD
jgi:hypothetical protein